LGGDNNPISHTQHYSEPENEEIFQEKGWSTGQTLDPEPLQPSSSKLQAPDIPRK
jgi:hypothetical protein